MKDNVVLSFDGIEVYRTKIHAIIDEYITSLSSEEELENPYTFRGMLKEIYHKLFQPSQSMPHNAQTIIDLEDIETLDKLWDLFASICYKYKTCPSLGRFSLLTGISQITFWNWLQENTRGNSHQHFKSVKRWKAECESAIEDNVLAKNSIGGIFTLKSCYNWRESAPVVQEGYISQVQSTPEEIAERYRDAIKPEIPQLD